MQNQKTMRIFVYLAVLVMCSSVSAIAQSSQTPELVAAVSSDSSEVRWQPRVEYGRLVLTVSVPGGEVFRKEFEAEATPSFKLTDEQGLSLPDGHYVYELRVVPKFSKEVRNTLRAAREKGNTAEVMQQLQRSGQFPTSVTVQSGSFLIQNGAVFSAAAGEPTEPRGSNPGGAELQSRKKGNGTVVIQDVVTPDDAIIQGSACIGLDCVNNESFGFDTIRLKENNTRIKFDDTSTQAGFAANDWQLTANDSAPGGANKFSIEDITGGKVPFTVTAGAPTNSIFVNSTGRLGLRTSTPVLDLHINTGDTPAHRLEQNNSAGFTAQTWDIAGNEANFFVRDVTSGSRLPFRIRPGAPTSSIDIAGSGNVGIGTQSPQQRLHVGIGSDASFTPLTDLLVTRNGTVNLGVRDSTNDVEGMFLAFSGGVQVGAGTNHSLSLMTNNLVRATVDTAGNMGIGTATPAGKLDVNGTIFQRGILLHADYVFEPTYSLESIEDHSSFMWNNKHLPALGARNVDEHGREVVEIGARMRGMLEEIEKAHIYITTLNESIIEKDARLKKLELQNAELADRLARIEAALSASKTDKK